jgi:hypothetical protein
MSYGGFGTAWGIGWGGFVAGSSESFYIESAIAVSSTSFEVTFSNTPQFASPLSEGDASNLGYWSLKRLHDNQTIPLLAVGPTESSNRLAFTIYGRWRSAQDLYRVTGSEDLLSTGNEALTNPRFADFEGSPEEQAASDQRLWDIRNPQTETGLPLSGLVVASNGDYDRETGLVLVKKLLIRRITTSPGAFVHLAARNYGLGVKAKEFYTASRLRKMREEIEQAGRLEPEVIALAANIRISSNNRMLVHVQAQTRYGALNFNLEPGA